MKAIINGLRYDTDKATLIGESGPQGSEFVTDFSHWEAALYRTPRSGRYFLAGEGGPMTIFAKHVGNECMGDSRIIPMDRTDALEWAEAHLTAKQVEAGFRDSLQDA